MDFARLFYTYSSMLRDSVRDCSCKLFYYVDSYWDLYTNVDTPSVSIRNMNGHWK